MVWALNPPFESRFVHLNRWNLWFCRGSNRGLWASQLEGTRWWGGSSWQQSKAKNAMSRYQEVEVLPCLGWIGIRKSPEITECWLLWQRDREIDDDWNCNAFRSGIANSGVTNSLPNPCGIMSRLAPECIMSLFLQQDEHCLLSQVFSISRLPASTPRHTATP